MHIKGTHGLGHIETGGRAEVGGNLQGPGSVTHRKLLCELEDAELAGHTDIALDIGHRHGSGAFRKILEQFVRLHGNGGEVRAHGLGQKACRFRFDLEPAFGIVA